MITTCLIYLTTHKDTYNNFLKLKNCICDFIDCYYVYDNKGDNLPYDENKYLFYFDNDSSIQFNGHTVWEKYNGYIRNLFNDNINRHYVGNPQFLTIELSKEKKFETYNNFYFIEDDIVMPNGNLKEFFEDCETINCDLLICTDKCQNNTGYWHWNNVLDGNTSYMYAVHHFLQLYRISRDGCNVIVKKFNKSHFAHSECAIPSIIYRNGLSTKFICNELPKYNFIIDFKKHLEYTRNFLYSVNTWYHPVKN